MHVVGYCCCCSVTHLCVTLCEPMDCSTPGFPVFHHLPEFAQTHVHWISDAIQLYHPRHPLLFLLSIFPSITIFSNELALCFRSPKHWTFIFSIGPSNYSNIQDLFPVELTGLISLQSKGLSRVVSNTTVQKQQYFSAQLSLWSNSHIHT